MEHISRKTIPRVDYLFVISDASARSVRSAGRIHQLVGTLNSEFLKEYLVVTKTQTGNMENLAGEIQKTEINLIGDIPYDVELVAFDEIGNPLFNLPNGSRAVEAIDDILKNVGI
jgi:CO dehydrogenase maturation factor